MISLPIVLLGITSLVSALPLVPRKVDALNQDAFKEAQQRDDGATRAFSNTEIKTSDGQCLFVDELSGDFRANLNPIQVAKCDGSQGQKWDIITAGKHNDQAGQMLVVNTLTQACLNFDPRRAAGNTVIMFSCGGRADGGGAVTDSQLFAFNGGSGPLAFQPKNNAGTCFAVKGGVIDQANCDNSAGQQFTFGAGGGAAAPPAQAPPAQQNPPPANTATAAPPAKTTAAPSKTAPAGKVPVSRAGGVLNPTAAAESNQRDNTATRAFSNVAVKASNGQCLTIDPNAGDFRQNLIPVAVKPCDGSAGQKFDFITKGKHNDQAGSTLVVSTLTQGCLNFDERRAPGDQVILFSCGGRADGEGRVTDSQLFKFTGAKSFTLAPNNQKGATCLAPKNGLLDQASCNGGADQTFTIA